MTIIENLQNIQSNLHVKKAQKNSFGGYNYRSCEDILEAVKPLLKEEDCTLTLSDGMVEIGGRVYVKSTATLANREGEATAVTACAREAETQKGMADAQITGAASSYARKYALNGLFAIDDTKDDDATNKHEKRNDTVTTKVETLAKEVVAKKCSTEDVLKIAGLCTDTSTDQKKLYEHFEVDQVPTPAQAVKIILSLEKKLNTLLNKVS